MALSGLLSFAHAILVRHFPEKKDCCEAEKGGFQFQIPLHYPRYGRSDYEKMEEWKLDLLLRDYGLDFRGTLDDKRKFAMGAFLWPHQY